LISTFILHYYVITLLFNSFTVESLLSFYSIMSELPQYEKESKESEEEEVSR